MAKYGLDLKRTASSATLALGIAQATATNPRRLKLYQMNLGSDDAATDDTYKYVVDEVTADGGLAGGTAATPRPLDSADPAAFFDAQDTAISTNPTIGNRRYAKTLNHRASHTWIASPGSEMVFPATNNNGFAVQTPTTTTAGKKVNAHCFIEEV